MSTPTNTENKLENLQDLSCKEAVRLMSYRRDRTLDAAEEDALRVHFAECINCCNYDQQIDLLAKMAKMFGKGSGAT
jgi:hypothetical protein